MFYAQWIYIWLVREMVFLTHFAQLLSFNIPVVCTELTCKAMGDRRCTFVIGSPKKIINTVDTDITSLYSFALDFDLNEGDGNMRRRSRTSDPHSNEQKRPSKFSKRRKK